MPTLSESIWVGAPRARVWRLLSDPSRFHRWLPTAEEVIYASEGPVRVGTLYRIRHRRGGGTVVGDWRVAVWEPPRLQVRKVLLPDMHAQLRITLEPDRDGTLWFHELDFRMNPANRLVGWLRERLGARRRLRSEVRALLTGAKALLESEEEVLGTGAQDSRPAQVLREGAGR